jgi:hypothetical protein
MNESHDRTNLVRAVGTLDDVRSGGRAATLVTLRNAVRGTELRCALQVRGPFGAPFQLPLRLDALVEGRELLDGAPGQALVAEGQLEWQQHEDARYAGGPTDRGRRVSEVIFRPHRIAPAGPEDDPGCDAWLEGVVRRDARRYLHPERRVPIAVVSVEVQVERARRGSLARMVEPVEVQVAIPVGHGDLPKLLRRGNRVGVEGMLERVVVPLRSDDAQVQRAVAALDERWTTEHGHGAARREDERRYARQRAALQQTVITRVVAGYVVLLAGEPASLAEARRMREAQIEQRAQDRVTRTGMQGVRPVGGDDAPREAVAGGDGTSDDPADQTTAMADDPGDLAQPPV